MCEKVGGKNGILWDCGNGAWSQRLVRWGEVPRTEAGRAACMESGPVAPWQKRPQLGRLLFDALEAERSRKYAMGGGGA